MTALTGWAFAAFWTAQLLFLSLTSCQWMKPSEVSPAAPYQFDYFHKGVSFLRRAPKLTR